MRQLPLVLLAFSASVAVWACTASAPSTDSSGAAQTVGNDGTTKSPKPAGSSKPAPTSSASASAVDAGTGDPCLDSCIQKHPKGAQVSEQAGLAFSSCICEATACASTCGQSAVCTDAGAEPQMGDACDQCMMGSGGDTCDQQAGTICDGDPDCGSFQDCLDQCDAANPGGPGGSGGQGGTSGGLGG
jgi:hypothetical protein